MNEHEAFLRDSAEDGTAVALFNSDGEVAEVNSVGAEVHRQSKEKLLGKPLTDFLADPQPKHGRVLEKALNGEIDTTEVEVVRGDGTKAIMKSEVEAVEVDGEPHILSEFEVVEELGETQADKTPDESTFDHISKKELEEITQNVRVDSPDGEMPLNAIMMDLAAGHNKLEQYKQGALTLYQCLDKRLKEEQKQNPDSKTCDVLEAVKDTAFGLYLRLQRGDKELHGERDGQYSGYFN